MNELMHVPQRILYTRIKSNFKVQKDQCFALLPKSIIVNWLHAIVYDDAHIESLQRTLGNGVLSLAASAFSFFAATSTSLS